MLYLLHYSTLKNIAVHGVHEHLYNYTLVASPIVQSLKVQSGSNSEQSLCDKWQKVHDERLMVIFLLARCSAQ